MWFYAAALAALAGTLCAFKRTRNSRPLWGQLCVIAFPFTLLFCAGLASPVRPAGVPFARVLVLALASLGFFLFCLAVYLRLARKDPPARLPVHRLFWAVLGLYALLQFLDLNVSPIWDAGLYYGSLLQAVESFEYTLPSFLASFSAQSHPTQALILLYAPGQYLFCGSPAALNTTTLLLGGAVLCAFYRVMQRLFGHNSLRAVLASALFAFMPQIFAFANGIAPDYGVMAGLVFLWYAFLYKRRVLTVAAALLVLFSKETGLIVYGGFGLGVILCDILPKAITKRSFGAFCLGCLRRWYLLLPFALFFANTLFGTAGLLAKPSRINTLIQGGSASGGARLGSLHFSPKHALTVLNQLFVLNFNWVLTLLALAGFVYWLAHGARRQGVQPIKHLLNRATGPEGWGLLAVSVLPYLAFSLVYYDFPLLRYNLSTLAALPAFGVAAMAALPLAAPALRRALPAGLLALYLSAIYFTWDPASLFAFPYGHSMGHTRLIDITNHTDFPFVCERHVYNRQYLNYSRLMDDIIADNGTKTPYVSYGIDPFAMQFFGNNEKDYRLVYSPSRQRRAFRAEDGVPIPGRELRAEDLAAPAALPQSALWIVLPYQPAEVCAEMQTRYEATNPRTYTRMGMQVTVYECRLLPLSP